MNLFALGGLIYGGLFLVGLCLSLLISYSICQKILVGSSLTEGAIWASLPSALYILGSYFPSIKGPFSRLFQQWFSLQESTADKLALGYLMMLGSLIMSTRMTHTTEVDVCKPSVDEMRLVKQQLLKELKEKQDAQEENEKKPTS